MPKVVEKLIKFDIADEPYDGGQYHEYRKDGMYVESHVYDALLELAEDMLCAMDPVQENGHDFSKKLEAFYHKDHTIEY